MKKINLFIGLVLLLLINYAIWSKEQILRHGQSFLLELRPVDPRSLMQGDYMRLDYQLTDQLRVWSPQGRVILKRDEQGIAHLQDFDHGQALQEGEFYLRYRFEHGRLKQPSSDFFFAEGQAQVYNRARYAEFKVNEQGESLLVGLRDEQGQKL